MDLMGIYQANVYVPCFTGCIKLSRFRQFYQVYKMGTQRKLESNEMFIQENVYIPYFVRHRM